MSNHGARLPGQFVKPHRMQVQHKMYFLLFVSLISVGLNIIKDIIYD